MTIKNRLIITTLTLLLVSTGVMACYTYRNQKGQLLQGLQNLARNENRLFTNILIADGEGLARAHLGLTRHELLLRLFALREKEQLLAAALPIFREMKEKNNITHMYFIEPDGTVFLRVHKPEQAGGRLQRATFKQAAAKGTRSVGLEMGKNFFSLRCVHPISWQGRPLGYLEVAQEIDHVFDQMKTITGHDSSLLLSDEFVRTNGMVVEGGKAAGYHLLESTSPRQALALVTALGARTIEEAANFGVNLVDHEGTKFAVGLSEVKDASGNLAGVLLTQKDVTAQYAVMWQGILTLLAIYAAIFGCGCTIVAISLRKSYFLFNDIHCHLQAVTRDWDLRRRIDTAVTDEVGQLGHDIDRMTERLADMVAKLHVLGGELGGVAGTIGGASRQVVTATREQTENVSSTVLAVTQIDASIREVAGSLDRLSQSAAETASSVTEMSASIEETAENTDHLANLVETVGSSIEEMAASIRQVRQNTEVLLESSDGSAASAVQLDATIADVEKSAAQSAALAARMLEDARKGKESVAATADGIRGIQDSARVTAAAVLGLSGKVKNIGSILSIIEDVTEQTSLLALNASIIAAQAGNHGRGFAVVAEEIKELAERTRNSTREIAVVLGGIQEETRQAVEAIRQTEQCVDQGGSLSQRAGEALDQIVSAVTESVEKVDAIAIAMREQGNGSRTIRDSAEKISEMVSQIVHANREQERAGDAIATSSRQMRELTEQVRHGARDQNSAGREIAKATDDVLSMIMAINKASEEQRSGSDQILRSVENIQVTSDGNANAARTLDQSLQGLTGQIDSLSIEIGRFKV